MTLGPAQPYAVPHVHDHLITSETGDEFRISVGLPVSYQMTNTTFPVLYVLDGDVIFGTALEQVRMRGAMQDVPEAIVVGIGYPVGTDFATYNTRRLFDFSTQDWDEASPMRQQFFAITESMGQTPRLGGLKPLLELITKQVQPAVLSQYRGNADQQDLFGGSAGGHFVCQAVFRAPKAFRSFFAASPALSYNDGQVFELEREYAATHTDLPATLYLSAGSEETLQLAYANLVSGTTRLAETLQLRGYESLRLRCDIHAGEGHVPAITSGLQRALETTHS
jgi:predicted alpha/beta superfamily hydrolase